ALLWDVPNDPRGALRWSLTKLRAIVDDPDRPRIVADRSTITFDRAGAHVDVFELRRACGNGLDELGTADLVRLAGEYRGPFLDELQLEDLHDFHYWCLGEREDARKLYVGVLTTLLDRLTDDPRTALPFARA